MRCVLHCGPLHSFRDALCGTVWATKPVPYSGPPNRFLAVGHQTGSVRWATKLVPCSGPPNWSSSCELIGLIRAPHTGLSTLTTMKELSPTTGSTVKRPAFTRHTSHGCLPSCGPAYIRTPPSAISLLAGQLISAYLPRLSPFPPAGLKPHTFPGRLPPRGPVYIRTPSSAVSLTRQGSLRPAHHPLQYPTPDPRPGQTHTPPSPVSHPGPSARADPHTASSRFSYRANLDQNDHILLLAGSFIEPLVQFRPARRP